MHIRQKLPEYLFPWILYTTSFLLHGLMAMSLGAKYWYDTVSYFQLADAILDPAALRELYLGQFGVAFQHLMPGLPLLIAITEKLAGPLMWPAFAIFQYGLSSLSCVYFVRSFNKYISSAGQVAAVVLISIFPYYSAFHGAILTESLTASICLFIIGTAVRGLDRRYSLARSLTTVLLLGLVGGQFRSYLVGVGAGCAVLLVFCSSHAREWWLYGLSVVTVVGSFLLFPIYRASTGAEFALPNVDAWMLMHVSYVAWDLDERSQRSLDGVVLDPAIRKKLISSQESLTMDDTFKMVSDLEAADKTRSEVRSLIAGAARTVRTQSLMTIERQIQLVLSSLGFQYFATCCNPEREIRRGYAASQMLGHYRNLYIWNAGLDRQDYRITFERYAAMNRALSSLYSQKVIDWYVERVGPYVKPHPHLVRYVTLPLALLPPDILILAGILGLVLVTRRDWRFLVLIGIVGAPIYLASLQAHVVGDNRHSHLLWPLYIIGTVALIERIVQSVSRARLSSRQASPMR